MSENQTRRLSITLDSWVKGALVVFLAYALFKISQILLVILVAIVIATAIEPALERGRRHGLPRIISAIIVYLGSAGILLIVFYFLLLPLIAEVSSFINTLQIYSNAFSNDTILSQLFANQEVFGGISTPFIMGELSSYLNSFSTLLSQGVFSTASLIFGGALSFILIVVLSFYLVVQEDGLGKLLEVIVPVRHEKYVLGLWRRAQKKIGLWLQGQLLLGVVVAFLVYLGLTIIGVPNALLLAVLAGLFELIPIFGPIISAIPAIFSAYSALGMTEALVVIALYLFIQQLENHVIYPMVVKKVVGVPPLVSILAILIGGQLAGFLGIVISVPVAVVVMEILSDLEQTKHLHHVETNSL